MKWYFWFYRWVVTNLYNLFLLLQLLYHNNKNTNKWTTIQTRRAIMTCQALIGKNLARKKSSIQKSVPYLEKLNKSTKIVMPRYSYVCTKKTLINSSPSPVTKTSSWKRYPRCFCVKFRKLHFLNEQPCMKTLISIWSKITYNKWKN